MTTHQIEAVFFDMGGVLMNVSPEYNRAAALEFALSGPEVRDYLGPEFSMEDFLEFMNRSIEARSEREPGIQEDAWREDKAILEAFTGKPVPYDVLREKFWKQISYMVQCFEPYSGIQEVLETIRSAGMIIGLISNVFHPAIIYKQLFTKWGIVDYFDPLLFSSEYKYKKPHRAIFEYALSWHPGILPSQTLFVGDTWEVDVLGAQGVGMKPVWVNAEYGAAYWDNVPVIRGVDGILELLG